MTNEPHEDVPDQIHWCDAVLAATDIPDARKVQLLYAAAMDYFGKWELVMMSLRDRTTEVDRLREALKQILWQADATEPLSVRAAGIATDALGPEYIASIAAKHATALRATSARGRR
jgi:hypothetical protein